MASTTEKGNAGATPPLEEIEALLTDSDDESLPKGWEMRVTEKGRVFYINHAERHTQWKHPKNGKEKHLSAALPFGWERGTDEKGEPVFIDHVGKRTTCVDPRIAYAMTKKKATSKFDSDSTAMAVLRGRDMRGKTALITGANSGIGFETAKALSLHGCHVVLLCRDQRKGEDAAEKIRKHQVITAAVDVLQCDLSSLDSVRECSQTYIKKNWPLHILICNAGVLGLPFGLSVDDIEKTFATNYLGHFYLTDLLKEILISSAPSRVVVVSAESHRFPSLYGDQFEVSDVPLREDEYWPILAYNQSKLCSLLFTFELNRRLSPYGVHCNAVNPGSLVHSRLQRNSYTLKFLFTLSRPFTKSKAQGAATTIYCATSHELEGVGGFYFNNCCGCQPSTFATNEKLAKELWEFSEKLSTKKIDSKRNILGFVRTL